MKMSSKKSGYASFEDWVSGASIYIGYARYGQLGGHGFVVASRYDDSGELRAAVDDLDGGDIEALQAAEKIAAMDCLYANHPDPAVAMQLLMAKLREFQRAVCEELQQRPKER